MKALVTGATGFIGGNLLRELVTRGYETRALMRKESLRGSIANLDTEVAVGDLRDRSSLDRALEGCDVLFHVAAAYSLWTPDPRVIYEINVQGTENLLSAARAAGTKKIVFTSSESTLGMPENGRPGTEELEGRLEQVGGHYKKSKLLAERLALRMAREGLPLVVVNPTTPLGPGDVKPTPTGQIVVDFLNRRMPAYVNTGLNFVDVSDVAQGHLLALEKGRVGERYLLGNRNMTLRELFLLLEELTALSAPRIRIPVWLALVVAYIDESVVSSVTKRPPRVPVAGVKAARKFRYFDCSKAVRELGMPQTPIEESLGKAVRWFRQNGYAP